MDIYLLDGTYELFRHFFALPPHQNAAGREVSATRGVLGSVLFMLESGNTHIGVATDHVIESFRNQLWETYKRGEGVDPQLLQQFPLLEDALIAMGVTVWPMVELEADDALAGAAAVADADPRVEKVFICTPDKDLGQCVREDRVVQLERRSGKVLNHDGIVEKFGVPPASIPDYLALVGDSADGFPGLPGWGSRSAATVLAAFGHLENIPLDSTATWPAGLRGTEKLAATLRDQFDLAWLFRDLATLRSEPRPIESVDELLWQGPTPDFAAICAELDSPQLIARAEAVVKKLSRA